MSAINEITPEEWDKIVAVALRDAADLTEDYKWKLDENERPIFGGEDEVDNPAHYNEGEIETIDYIVDVLGEWDSIHYCHGNILKYLSTRLWTKGKPLQDAKKARWYLNKMIDLMEKTEGDKW